MSRVYVAVVLSAMLCSCETSTEYKQELKSPKVVFQEEPTAKRQEWAENPAWLVVTGTVQNIGSCEAVDIVVVVTIYEDSTRVEPRSVGNDDLQRMSLAAGQELPFTIHVGIPKDLERKGRVWWDYDIAWKPGVDCKRE